VASSNYLRSLRGLKPFSREEVLELVGRGAPFLAAGLTGAAEGSAELMELLTKFRDHYLEHQTERSELYPDARETLDELGRRHELFVLSNKPHSAVMRELEARDLRGRFRAIWGAGSLDVMKPDPAGVIEAMRLCGATAAETVMIGDSGIDVSTGVNAGVATIFAAWGFNPLGSDDPEPTAVAGSFAELGGAVERVLQFGLDRASG
jgi:phosphoglycolate phosphatase